MIPAPPVPQMQQPMQPAIAPMQQPVQPIVRTQQPPRPQAISITKKSNDGDELMLGIIIAAQSMYEKPQVQPGAGNPGMPLKPGWGGQNK